MTPKERANLLCQIDDAMVMCRPDRWYRWRLVASYGVIMFGLVALAVLSF